MKWINKSHRDAENFTRYEIFSDFSGNITYYISHKKKKKCQVEQYNFDGLDDLLNHLTIVKETIITNLK